MKILFRTLAFALACAASSAHACEYCLIGQGISPLETQNGAGLKLGQRYTLLDSVYEGSDKVDNPGVKEEYWTTEIGAFYSITDRFLVLLNVPLRKTRGDGELVEGPDGAPEREGSPFPQRQDDSRKLLQFLEEFFALLQTLNFDT